MTLTIDHPELEAFLAKKKITITQFIDSALPLATLASLAPSPGDALVDAFIKVMSESPELSKMLSPVPGSAPQETLGDFVAFPFEGKPSFATKRDI